jgi:hypothetical protein
VGSLNYRHAAHLWLSKGVLAAHVPPTQSRLGRCLCMLSCASFGFGHRYPTLIAGRPPPCTEAISSSLVCGRLTLPLGESGGS